MEITKTLIALVVIFFSTITFASSVNINVASANEIAAALNGVGSAKAQAIIEYRTANGNFTNASQIVNVSGIGPATYEKNKEDILVK
ncbi:MAG: competence protein ComEA [Gammaproteobacteria bacterium]|jgi:competence protein ComEA|tara:strand:+ start:270 stop:530 length:261 start_codon:yes stop_codon:yes gene_type:complete